VVLLVKRGHKALVWAIIFIVPLLSAVRIISQSVSGEPSSLIINEFLASNGAGLQDEEGDYSDWIEIYNRSDRPVNLGGWSLTDDREQPDKWAFPDISLGGREYLVVFASGKNRKPVEAQSELHTNFRLRQEGEFLGLYNVLQGRWMDVTLDQFPGQVRDISYGRYGDRLAYGYLAKPTPGGVNDETLVWEGILPKVMFKVERGFYETPFALELSNLSPGSVIRYTMDGSEPTETHGMIYTAPIRIDTTAVVRAAAFKPNFLTAGVDTHSYIFLDSVLAQPAYPAGFPTTWGSFTEDLGDFAEGSPVIPDYEMDTDVVNDPRYRASIKDGLKSIPTMSIVTDIRNLDIYTNPTERGIAWERPVSIELIYPDSYREGFQINAGIRIHGGVGRNQDMPKHSFRLYFRGEYGVTKLEYPIFADSPVNTFDTLVLRAGTHDGYAGPPGRTVSMSNYTRDEWLRESQIAMSGLGPHGTFVHLYLNGLYWGLYNLVERPDDSFLSSYLGGRKEDWYAINQRGLVSGPDEKVSELLELIGIENHEERYEAIRPFIDTKQFIDYLVLNWYAGTRDWPVANWYAGVQYPTGKLRYFVWDGERILSDGARIRGEESDAAPWPDTIRPIFVGLKQSPDFRIELADRMYKHLYHDGTLTDANSQTRWMRINDSIDRAIIGESARWGDVRSETPITRDDWLKARDAVLSQMDGNAAKLIGLAREVGYYPDLDPPTFNQHGGMVTMGFELTMTASRGTIYYTTDGSDPRLLVTGEVAPTAVAYNAPLVLTDTTWVKARVLDTDPATSSGQVWSALHEATFKLVRSDSKLRITEVMYNPVGGGDYEFIELQNAGQGEVDVSNMYFEGILHTFPAGRQTLAPGEVIVLVRNPEAFAERYPGVAIDGVYQGQLSNQGERITLRDFTGDVVVSVAYDDEYDWPISPDGRGDSLVLVNLDGDPDDPRNWRASAHLYGSPGLDEPEAW
jgi:hypothetical protein